MTTTHALKMRAVTEDDLRAVLTFEPQSLDKIAATLNRYPSQVRKALERLYDHAEFNISDDLAFAGLVGEDAAECMVAEDAAQAATASAPSPSKSPVHDRLLDLFSDEKPHNTREAFNACFHGRSVDRAWPDGVCSTISAPNTALAVMTKRGWLTIIAQNNGRHSHRVYLLTQTGKAEAARRHVSFVQKATMAGNEPEESSAEKPLEEPLTDLAKAEAIILETAHQHPGKQVHAFVLILSRNRAYFDLEPQIERKKPGKPVMELAGPYEVIDHLIAKGALKHAGGLFVAGEEPVEPADPVSHLFDRADAILSAGQDAEPLTCEGYAPEAPVSLSPGHEAELVELLTEAARRYLDGYADAWESEIAHLKRELAERDAKIAELQSRAELVGMLEQIEDLKRQVSEYATRARKAEERADKAEEQLAAIRALMATQTAQDDPEDEPDPEPASGGSEGGGSGSGGKAGRSSAKASGGQSTAAKAVIGGKPGKTLPLKMRTVTAGERWENFDKYDGSQFVFTAPRFPTVDRWTPVFHSHPFLEWLYANADGPWVLINEKFSPGDDFNGVCRTYPSELHIRDEADVLLLTDAGLIKEKPQALDDPSPHRFLGHLNIEPFEQAWEDAYAKRKDRGKASANSRKRAKCPRDFRAVFRNNDLISELEASEWEAVELPPIKRMATWGLALVSRPHPLDSDATITTGEYPTILSENRVLNLLWRDESLREQDWLITAPKEEGAFGGGYGPTTIEDAKLWFPNATAAVEFRLKMAGEFTI